MAMDNARLYADAQRAIAARDAILAAVSHDLRNPLASIRMNISLMSMEPADGRRAARSHKAIDAVDRAAERMTRLIQADNP